MSIIKIKRPDKLNFSSRVYLVEILKGMRLTMGHFIKNILSPSKILTQQYPEEKPTVLSNYRGMHRLMKNDDDSLKCTACFLCATACPADCINIEAGDAIEDKIETKNEKYPKKYEIDELKCVFCGLCAEACPLDAIRLDSGEYDFADYTRESLYFNKERLQKNGYSN